QEEMLRMMRETLAGKMPTLDVESRFVTKEGAVQWRLVRGIVTRDEAGTPLTFMGTSVDIDRLKRAEEKARVAEEEARRAADQLQLATKLSGITVWSYDLDGDDMNQAHASAGGPSMEEFGFPPMPRQSWRDRIAVSLVPEDRPRVHQAAQDCIDGKTAQYE